MKFKPGDEVQILAKTVGATFKDYIELYGIDFENTTQTINNISWYADDIINVEFTKYPKIGNMIFIFDDIKLIYDGLEEELFLI